MWPDRPGIGNAALDLRGLSGRYRIVTHGSRPDVYWGGPCPCGNCQIGDFSHIPAAPPVASYRMAGGAGLSWRPADMSDERLIARLKTGDKEALRQIYMQYKDMLLTVATSMLRDVHAAEDVLQDVFVSFASGVRSLDVRVNLKKYL
ncbi:MAG TPA: sigma-70 family RNA polymerase sigma factor, partial [Phycisphaerales bacterium]|nr:sigma-70 family RNA polymerase sigma factor [Phycisphaerales bacterium]